MKLSTFAIGLVAAATCLTLQAQSIRATANVPFEFKVGKATLPAGEYTIRHANGVLWAQNTDGHSSAAALTITATRRAKAGEGKLYFTCVGRTCFLDRVWAPDSTDGVLLYQTPAEKELLSRAAAAVEMASVRAHQ